jgi:alanyl-tRNA synthetase
MELGAQVRDRLGEAAVVLGSADDGKVALVALMSPGATARGLSAETIVREAAALVGGGGGGRDDAAQAGGRDPEKLDEALAAARSAIVAALTA